MSGPRPEELATVAEFLAHAHALECECEDRLTDLAGTFEEHNNPPAAEAFRRVERLVEERVRRLEERAAGEALPKIPPWECSWHCAVNTEAMSMEHAHYMMTPAEVLRLVREKMAGVAEFYRRVAEGAASAEVRQAAEQSLAESRRHADEIEAWLEREIHEPPPEDLDPPSMPE